MMKFQSILEILDFAIRDEEKAAAFYKALARKMKKGRMARVFEEFSREELGHKKKLLAVKKGRNVLTAKAKVPDLRLAEQLADVPPSSELDYQDALILAMKGEKAAYRLYTELAEQTESAAMREVLEGLAREEANHKLRFEIEYETHFLDEDRDGRPAGKA